MRYCLASLLRLVLVGAVGVGVVAVGLGRCLPEREGDVGVRRPSPPRYHGINNWSLPGSDRRPCLLDAATGAVRPIPLAPSDHLDNLSCSPWRDGRGQFHLIGRWQRFSGGGAGGTDDALAQRSVQCLGLAICTYPAGEIVDRIPLDSAPLGPPCWSPDTRDLIVYVDGDAQLYSCAVDREAGRADSGSDSLRRPVPLRWRIPPPGRGRIAIQDLHWPTGPSLAGYLLVSLRLQEPSTGGLSSLQLWWLRLGQDGMSIVEAGRLITEADDPGGTRADLDEARLPRVGLGGDGTPILAYLVRGPRGTSWELWLAPFLPGPSGGAPRVLRSSRLRLAEGCEVVAPAFSPDGRWVHVVRREGGAVARLERLAVPHPPAPRIP